MTYSFIKRYNPAYDYFLEQFFAKKGIKLEDEATYPELRKKLSALKATAQEPDRLFVDYLSDWRLHPESRPSFDFFLERIFEDRKLTLLRLKTLQAELPSSRGKLVLSQEDVATEIFNFYGRLVTRPLRKDIETRASVLKVLEYLDAEDSESLSSNAKVDRREYENLVRIKASELLAWLEGLRVEDVDRDISFVLSRHFEGGYDMKLVAGASKSAAEPAWCEHDSKLVQLRYPSVKADSDVSWTLAPSRGYGLIEDGWKHLLFPRYRVLKKS